MKFKSWIFELLRWAAVAAIAVYLIVLLGADPLSDASVETVADAVTSQMDMANLRLGENQMVKRLYGLDPSAYEGCVLYYPATNMDAEEMLLVKLMDVSQQETVRNAMLPRVENQKNTFEGYGVEQFDLLSNHCVLEIKGNYALLIVSKSCDDACKAFEAAL